MKNVLYLICLFFTTYSLSVSAQDCTIYFPIEEGTMIELTSYNKKDKVTGYNRSTIIEKSGSGSNIEIIAKMQAYDKKGDDPLFEAEYAAVCENGAFSINMNAAMASGASAGGNIKMEGDFLDIPSNPKAGQMLEDKRMKGTIAVDESSTPNPMASALTFNYEFVNRKVEAIEEITTPAGTFDAIKISYDMNMKMMMSFTFHIVDWYVEEVGIVRTESYRKGKLDSYSVLTKLEK